MHITRKPFLVVALSAGMLASTATGALAYGSYGGGSYGGELKAVSYINSDAGKNADVTDPSNCFTPDDYDKQAFSTAASGSPGNNNVHNDACFLDARGDKVGKGIGATFDARGVGFISACPDPDLTPATATRAMTNGPETARALDTNATAAATSASRAATRTATSSAGTTLLGTSSTTPASTTRAWPGRRTSRGAWTATSTAASTAGTTTASRSTGP